MTGGDPIPNADVRRLWIIPSCMITVPPLSKLLHKREDEEISSDLESDPFSEDLLLFFDLEGKPEQEWSRYEKRRMRRLAERISRYRR